MSAWIDVLGRLHPLILHLPIGLVAALAVMEVAAWRRGDAPARATTGALVAACWLTSVATAASGLRLGGEEGYAGATLEWHERLGVSFALVQTLTALAFLRARERERRAPYRGLLALGLILLVPTGHLGSSLTRGADFLLAPLHAARDRTPPRAPAEPSNALALSSTSDSAADPAAVAAQASQPEAPAPAQPVPAQPVYEGALADLLRARCASCHGETKHKGGLALHTWASVLRGGTAGPVIVPGDPAASELVRRLRLPLGDPDEEHMPPDGKTQLSEEEIRGVEAWIAAGAAAGRAALESATPAPVPAAAPRSGDDVEAEGATTPDEDAGREAHLETLRDALVHVEALPASDAGLWIDFAAVALSIDDARAAELLAPIAPRIVELGLARTRVGDATARLCASFPRLRKLDLRATLVGDEGAIALARAPVLAELVLSQTKVGDAGLEALAKSASLERVFVWETRVSDSALRRLIKSWKDEWLDAGTRLSDALETEPPPTFTSDRPLPGAPVTPQENGEAAPAGAGAHAPAAALAAGNARCPVSGSPVDPRYTVLFEGRLIGFCCPNCPKTFWDSPQAFLSKLDGR